MARAHDLADGAVAMRWSASGYDPTALIGMPARTRAENGANHIDQAPAAQFAGKPAAHMAGSQQ